MSEEKFVDFATVRDLLYEAQDRRGQLTYNKQLLQHRGLQVRQETATKPTQRYLMTLQMQ